MSVDTTRAEVAERALADGAAVVNTVSLDPAAALGALCAREGAALVLMHCRGSMTSMRGFSAYEDAAYRDVVADVGRELLAAAESAMAAGIRARGAAPQSGPRLRQERAPLNRALRQAG